jgi:hypothetical protein
MAWYLLGCIAVHVGLLLYPAYFIVSQSAPVHVFIPEQGAASALLGLQSGAVTLEIVDEVARVRHVLRLVKNTANGVEQG